MSEPRHIVLIEGESDKYVDVFVEPVAPTWRDLWAILRGRYQPKVVKRRQLTPEGIKRELKNAWTESLSEPLNQPSPLLQHINEQTESRTGVFPIIKRGV